MPTDDPLRTIIAHVGDMTPHVILYFCVEHIYRHTGHIVRHTILYIVRRRKHARASTSRKRGR